MIGALSPHNIFFASWNYLAIFQRMLTITLVQFLHSWTFSKKCHVFTWFTTENHTNSSRNITWKSAHSNSMHIFSFKRKSLFFLRLDQFFSMNSRSFTITVCWFFLLSLCLLSSSEYLPCIPNQRRSMSVCNTTKFQMIWPWIFVHKEC